MKRLLLLLCLLSGSAVGQSLVITGCNVFDLGTPVGGITCTQCASPVLSAGVVTCHAVTPPPNPNPPPTGPISCPGFTQTVTINIPWAPDSGYIPAHATHGTAVVGVYKIPLTAKPNPKSPGSIKAFEYRGDVVRKYMSISTTPCIWLPADGTDATYQTDPTLMFTVGPNGSQGKVPSFNPGDTIYISIMMRDPNTNAEQCDPGQNCSLAIENKAPR